MIVKQKHEDGGWKLEDGRLLSAPFSILNLPSSFAA
jgi:hypothetical protein